MYLSTTLCDKEIKQFLGMFIHGMAGDLAQEVLGSDFMTATDQIYYLSKAFKCLRISDANP